MELWLALGLAVVAVVFGYFTVAGRVVALIAVLFGMAFYAFNLNSGGGSTAIETSVIQNYQADYSLDENGELTQVETLDVKFYEQRRGIFRFFDESGPSETKVQHPVEVISIERCPRQVEDFGTCVPEPYILYEENGYLVARIGDKSVPYPPGTVNRYVITSKQTGTITQVEGEPEAQWYWNVVGAGWQMPMYQVTVTTDFPVAPTGVACLFGTGDLEQPCEVSEQSDKRYVTQLPQLDPMTPVTWKAMLPTEGLTVVELSDPWYNNAIPTGIGVLLALGMIGLIRIAHDPKPSETPVFAAPGDDILAYTWTLKERPPDDIFQALLLQLRHLGTLQISLDPAMTPRRKPKFVTLQRTDRALPDGVIGSRELLDTLGLNTPGSEQDIKQKSVSMGRKINALQADLRTASTGQARAYRWYDYSALGRLTVLVAALLPALTGVTLVASESVWLATMFFIPGIAGLWATADLKTRLTAEGRKVRDQIAGLKVALGTSASVERYEYSLRAQYFEQFLPWAVALGCADKWAEACKPPPGMDTDPASPMYSYYALYYTSQSISEAVSSVSQSAVSSYSASQSSSGGGGGGGFSGGGGGGGGGGGSW